MGFDIQSMKLRAKNLAKQADNHILMSVIFQLPLYIIAVIVLNSMIIDRPFLKMLLFIAPVCLIKILINIGYARYTINITRENNAGLSDMLEVINNFNIHTILSGIFKFITAAAFLVLLVITIFLPLYWFKPIYWVAFDDPELSVFGIMHKSIKLMKGHKKEWLNLDIKLLPYHALNIVTLGFASFYTKPIIRVIYAEFYEYIKEGDSTYEAEDAKGTGGMIGMLILTVLCTAYIILIGCLFSGVLPPAGNNSEISLEDNKMITRYIEQNNYEEAKKIVDNSKSEGTLYLYITKCIENGRFPEAWEEINKLPPDHIFKEYYEARCYMGTGEYDLAARTIINCGQTQRNKLMYHPEDIIIEPDKGKDDSSVLGLMRKLYPNLNEEKENAKAYISRAEASIERYTRYKQLVNDGNYDEAYKVLEESRNSGMYEIWNYYNVLVSKYEELACSKDNPDNKEYADKAIDLMKEYISLYGDKKDTYRLNDISGKNGLEEVSLSTRIKDMEKLKQ